MPAAGRYESQGSKYSCVAPGPPCSNSNLMRGLLPKRLVQTLNIPCDVLIGMSRTPPENRSLRAELSRYSPHVQAADASAALFWVKSAPLRTWECAGSAWRCARERDGPGSL